MALSGLGPTVLWVLWTETIIALIFVCLRLYTRATMVRKIGLDDHLAWISMFFFFIFSMLVTAATLDGLGNHASDLSPELFAASKKLELLGETCTILAMMTAKASIAFFLIRIGIAVWQRNVLLFCVFGVSVVCFCSVAFMFFQCAPIESIWDPRVTGECYFDLKEVAVFSGGFMAAIDFFLALSPAYILWNAEMKPKERGTVLASLSLGVLAGIFGIARTLEINKVPDKTDYSYSTVPMLLWSSNELFVSLLCATMPGLSPLYQKLTCCSCRLRNRAPSDSESVFRENIFQRSSSWHTQHSTVMSSVSLRSSEKSLNRGTGWENIDDERGIVFDRVVRIGEERPRKMSVAKTHGFWHITDCPEDDLGDGNIRDRAP